MPLVREDKANEVVDDPRAVSSKLRLTPTLTDLVKRVDVATRRPKVVAGWLAKVGPRQAGPAAYRRGVRLGRPQLWRRPIGSRRWRRVGTWDRDRPVGAGRGGGGVRKV
ncbi:MAG: hypothetical protein IPL93_15275 [Actinomycetales bacterium]|nr:hypothetical protein [Actinomycetales bacterium]